MKNNNSVQIESLREYYLKLQSSYKMESINTTRYSTPVNFKLSSSCPIHRWFNYKEGFSPKFVEDCINMMKKNENDVIYDPFGGVGTTVLVASHLGHKAFYTDVNPLAIFVAKVKNHKYKEDELETINMELIKFSSLYDFQNVTDVPNDTVKKYFSQETLLSILKNKSYIQTIQDDVTKNIFFLALLSLLEVISTHKKDGNGVKRKSKIVNSLTFTDFRDMLIERIRMYVEDIKAYKIIIEPSILTQSCIKDYSLQSKVDIVITSPPYANCFDYSKVYLTELWFGDFFKSKDDQKEFRENSVTSHVHYKWSVRNESFEPPIIKDVIIPLLKDKKLWSKNIPCMLKGYFSDMGKFLLNLSQNLNNDASVGIVVGNSVYAGVVVCTDLILSAMAEIMGYKVEKIVIYRELTSSPQQMTKIDSEDRCFLRESMIYLKWKK